MKDSKEESKADNMADNKENDLPDIVADLKNPMKKRGIIRMCERVAASGGTPTPYSA